MDDDDDRTTTAPPHDDRVDGVDGVGVDADDARDGTSRRCGAAGDRGYVSSRSSRMVC